MKKYTHEDLVGSGGFSYKEVLYNIDAIEDYLNRYGGIYFWYDVSPLHKSLNLEDIKLIKRIKTKNDALLNFKNGGEIVREHCKQILEA